VTPPALRTGRRLAALAVVAALAAAAGLGFQRVFGLPPVIPVVAVAAVAPVLVSLLVSGVWRPPAPAPDARAAPAVRPAGPLWLAIVAQVVVWFAVVAGTLYRDAFAGGPSGLLVAIASGLRNSYRAMLTTILPAPARPELLIGAQVVVWLAAFVGAEIALRTRTAAAPAVPAVAAFGVALVLGVDGPGSNLPLAAALVALTLVLLLLRSADRLGRLAAGLPSALVIAAVAAVVAPYLPASGTPYDPREHVQAPPPQQRDSISPLDRVSAWLENPGEPLFTVRANAAENWRLAVLDTFDGATWTSSGHFMPSGSRVPAATPADGGGRGARTTVTQRITLRDLPGVWLPAADRPRSVTGIPVTVDPASGVVTAAGTPHAGQSYDVTSAARDYSADELARAVPASDAAARAATVLPSSAGGQKAPQVARFQRLAQRATAGADSPFAQAVKLADYLRTHGTYDVRTPPGHTYRHLDFFLNVTHHGTSEQFGTAYAVLARTLGLPTRVVVGFRPGRQVNGSWQVDSGDVLVWPEVDFSGLGWVPFFPTPERQSSSRQSQSVPVGQTQQKLEKQQQSAESRAKGRAHARRPQQPHHPAAHHRTTAPPSTPWWWYAAGAGAAAVLAYLIAIALVPALRRYRRRRSPRPGDRVLGAWHQTLDHLTDVGLPRSRALTGHEVAGFAHRTIGDAAQAHLRPLADLVNRTRYAPPDLAAQEPDAEAAWHHTKAINHLVTKTKGPFRRTARRLHPRTLRPRR
jgi:transglutaminase-like putative cysteine protease